MKIQGFAWKHLESGSIIQNGMIATSKEMLFEASGFGAVNVNEPIKGCLAVPVRYMKKDNG